MANVMRKAMRWLHEQRHGQMAEPVQYLRRALQLPLTIHATLAVTDREQVIEQELFLNAQMRDFIVRTGDLVSLGVFVEPEPGDRITVLETGGLFEVCELGSRPCWRYSDEYEQAVRIHAKLIATGNGGLS